mmetsp:Transcript_14269/g.21494  ORF Transcript_14269/g.21494 Transcript_14269/m.21494 type:complete len:325 (+) Transcript_14269:3-977(+)
MTNPFEMGPGPVIIGGGGLMGSSICTYSPNTTCFPNTDGFPPCCTDSTCTSEYPPCEDSVIGGDPLGSSICTNSPNTDCWPNTNGFPPCCADPSTCPSQSEFELGVNPPCEEPAVLLGSSFCTETPDTECYHMGQPACCFINQLECPTEKPGCDKQAGIEGGSICTYSPDTVCWPSTNGWPLCCADPSSCPSPSEFEAGVNPPCEDPVDMPILGSNPCTYAPDKLCYPSNNGWPICCKETPDGSSCSKDEPCENDEFLPNDVPAPAGTFTNTSLTGEEPVPAPSGEEPVGIEEATGAPSSSTILSMSLITLVGAHAVAIVAGMW